MHNPALLILNLRRQASRARRLAEGVRSDIQARLLTYADEFDSQAQALEAEADLSSAGEPAQRSLQR